MLKADDLELQVQAVATGSIQSSLTGRCLKRYEATFKVEDEPTKDAVRSVLGDGTGLTLNVDGVALPCDRGRWSTREQEGYVTMTVFVELTEHEDITPTAVTLGDFTLHPTRYEESLASDNKRVMVMTVVLGGEDTLRLREYLRAEKPFEVTRHGVSDAPIALRAGNAVHSLNDDGTTKTRFALVEPGEINSSFFGSFAALLGNTVKLVADERRRSNDLLRLLNEKGILSEADVAALATKNDHDEREICYSLFEVQDADAGWL